MDFCFTVSGPQDREDAEVHTKTSQTVLSQPARRDERQLGLTGVSPPQDGERIIINKANIAAVRHSVRAITRLLYNLLLNRPTEY